MRQAPLEERSITELRSMAQAMGAAFDFKDDKNAVMKIIRDHMAAKVPKPRTLEPLMPADTRFITHEIPDPIEQNAIVNALAEYTSRGLVLTFPTVDTWQISRDNRQDSGTTRAPLVDIVRCAREVMK